MVLEFIEDGVVRECLVRRHCALWVKGPIGCGKTEMCARWIMWLEMIRCLKRV